VRAVYGAVRNQRWETLWPSISELKILSGSDSFSIQFAARVEEEGVSFRWKCHMEGTADGVVRIRFDGRADSNFLKNRVGLCLLLPFPECCGRSVEIRHGDGSLTEHTLPSNVAPHQPVKNVRELRVALKSGGECEITFAGETFEMEDQRNWGDASLKVYSTPIEDGWPKLIEAGTCVTHEITLRASPRTATQRSALDAQCAAAGLNAVSVRHSPPLTRPNLGVTLGVGATGPRPEVVQRLAALKLGHVRLNIDLAGADHDAMEGAAVQLLDGRRLAAELGVPVLICVRVGDDVGTEVTTFIAACRALASGPLPVVSKGRWGLFQKTRPVAAFEACNWIERLVAELGGEPVFVTGSDEHLAELNRNRPEGWQRGRAWMNFPWNPQSHLVDLSSMFENLASIEMCVASASGFTGGGITLSPIRLQADPDRWSRGGVTSHEGVDPRQVGLVTAAWTVGLIGVLCGLKNLELATVFDAFGDAGLMGDGSDPEPGDGLVWNEAVGRSAWVYPVYHVFREFGRGRRFFSVSLARPNEAGGFAFEDDSGRLTLVVASFVGRPQRIEVRELGLRGEVRYLDERTVMLAMRDPQSFGAARLESLARVDGGWSLELLPYSLATLT